ncbi:MAG TPA: rRNA maturation RNase YbeY [Chthoniobacterales bacterium]
MNPAIKLVNRQRKRRLDLRACQTFAEAAVARVGRHNLRIVLPDEICVFFVSDARIRRIHRDFLAADEPTDVITFHHGEIFISVETAERHAQQFSTSLSEEIHLYIVHALLHLAGFEDKTERGYKRMKAVQERVAHEIDNALGG